MSEMQAFANWIVGTPDYASLAEDGYNPYKEDVDVNDPMAAYYASSRSSYETQAIRLRVQEEMQARRTLEQSGALGIFLSLGTEIFAPSNLLIPFGLGVPSKALLKATTRGGALRGALRGSLLTGGSVAVGEGFMQGGQITRTAEESLYAIGGGVALGSLLGGSVNAFRTARLQTLEVLAEVEARQGELAQRVVKYLEAQDFANQPMSRQMELHEYAFRRAGEEIGVEFGEVVTPKSAIARYATRGLRFSVNGVGATSKSSRMRAFTHQMMDTVFGRTRIGAVGPSMESRIALGELHLTGAHEAGRMKWTEYRKLKMDGPGAIENEDAFFEQVGQAMRNNDKAHAALDKYAREAVEETASVYRDWINDYVEKPMLEAGFLNKHDMTLKGTAPSYLTRYFRRNEIAMREDDFVRDVADALMREQGLDAALAKEQAQSLFDTIVGDPAQAMTMNLPGAPVPSYDRTLMLSDKALGPWIENDIRLVTNKLVTHTYPQLKLATMSPSAGGFMAELRRIAGNHIQRTKGGDVNAANDFAEETLNARARSALVSKFDEKGLEQSEQLGALAKEKHSKVESARNEAARLRSMIGDEVEVIGAEAPDENLVITKTGQKGITAKDQAGDLRFEYGKADGAVRNQEAIIAREEDELLEAMELEEAELGRTEYEWWEGAVREAERNPKPLDVSDAGFNNWAKENAPHVIGERRRYKAVESARKHREKMTALVNRRRAATAKAKDEVLDLERRIEDLRDELRSAGADTTRKLRAQEKNDRGMNYLKERLKTARKNARKAQSRQADAERRWQKADDAMPEPVHVARERLQKTEKSAHDQYVAEKKRETQREPTLHKKDLKAKRKNDTELSAAKELRKQVEARIAASKRELKKLVAKRDKAKKALDENEEATLAALSEEARFSYTRIQRLQSEIADLDKKIVALRKEAKKIDTGMPVHPRRFDKEFDPEAAVPQLQSDLTTTTRTHAMRGASGSAHIRGIDRQWREIIRNAPTKDVPRLERERKKDIETATLMVKRLTNMADLEDNPDALYKKLTKDFRNLNFVRFMGGVALSSLPDLMMGVLVYGTGPYIRAMTTAMSAPIKNLVRRDPPDKIAKLIAALDATTNMRTRRAFVDPTGEIMGTAKPTFSENVSMVFSKLTLINFWNSRMRMVAALMAQDDILRLSLKVADGTKLTKVERMNARLAGLTDDHLRRIASQYRRRMPDGRQVGQADKSGLLLSRSEHWDDDAVREIYEAAVLMDVNRTIIQPSKGDMPAPIFNSPELTKTILQFKSFSMSATNKVLASGLERLSQGDVNVVYGAIGMVMLGGLAETLRRELSGRDQPEDFGDFMFSAIDRSGILGILMEANNIIDQGTALRGPLNAILGAPTSTRYDARNILDVFLGPSLGTAQDTISASNSLINILGGGQATPGEVARMRRLLPFQNLFYTRWLFDEIQDSATQALIQ